MARLFGSRLFAARLFRSRLFHGPVAVQRAGSSASGLPADLYARLAAEAGGRPVVVEIAAAVPSAAYAAELVLLLGAEEPA